MMNKNVCPNCGQLYDTDLSKCPLCGTAPQVVDTGDPVQRKRITEAERKQRRADRKEAEQEAKRRRKDAQLIQDAEEERLIEEEEERRREEKRRRKEEKKAARRQNDPEELREEPAEAPVAPEPGFTVTPDQEGRKPQPAPPVYRDRTRVPRIFLILSCLCLLAALAVGGSYLLWKLEVVELPIFDKLAAQKAEAPGESGQPTGTTGQRVAVESIRLDQERVVFTAAGEQTSLTVTLEPADTTDEQKFQSSDETVARVSPVGIVTAVAPGTAVITVSCGDESAQCAVVCDFSEETQAQTETALQVEELILIKDDMSFFAAGENYVLSVTNIPGNVPVEWTSQDESVCTVDQKGHVVAVGGGTTKVVATVGELSASCIVRCKFE